MRQLTVLLVLLASPARAWDFTPVPVCTLRHDTGSAALSVTYDPRQPQPYAISITLAAPWPASPSFAIRFDGGRAMTIGTDRHRLSNEGRTLSVTDTGFGNVLDGLEFNRTATALAGPEAVPVPLDGAAPEVEKFRACTEAPTA